MSIEWQRKKNFVVVVVTFRWIFLIIFYFHELEFLIDIKVFFWVVKCLINITRCNSITRSSLYILSNGIAFKWLGFVVVVYVVLKMNYFYQLAWIFIEQTKKLKYLSMAVSYVCWPIYSLWIVGASWHWLQFT